MNRDIYQDPLTGKYASKEMQALFSEKRKFETWRTCRIVLAEAQQALGLDFITDTMLDEMRKSSKTINYEVAEEKEREIHHDVMAHIYEFGTHCPTAKGILHLGATSQFVNDNTELLQIKKGLDLVKKKLVRVIANLAQIAERYKDLVSL